VGHALSHRAGRNVPGQEFALAMLLSHKNFSSETTDELKIIMPKSPCRSDYFFIGGSADAGVRCESLRIPIGYVSDIGFPAD